MYVYTSYLKNVTHTVIYNDTNHIWAKLTDMG